ncbi:unnamed protein product [Polarella glacialis]|uniref:Uncharacterized protein n=1 Tax=Polarella glacialis TaxID=89957 RepID=A0A813K917_POLGL|nr:unnamed protein product [Polarella glacialis]
MVCVASAWQLQPGVPPTDPAACTLARRAPLRSSMSALITVSSTKISLLTVIVNNKNSSKTSSKQQKIKLIEEKCYWNQPYCSGPAPSSVGTTGGMWIPESACSTGCGGAALTEWRPSWCCCCCRRRRRRCCCYCWCYCC